MEEVTSDRNPECLNRTSLAQLMNLLVWRIQSYVCWTRNGPKQTLLKFPAVVMSFMSRIIIYADAITLKTVQ